MSAVHGRRIARAVGAAVTATALAGTLAVFGTEAARAAAPPAFRAGSPIATGRTVYDFAVDPAQHIAYAPSAFSDTVSFIDLGSGTTTQSVPVGRQPVAAALDPTGHALFVANYLGNSVSVIDTATATVTATIPVDTNPNRVAVDPGLHTVYVANAGSGTVSVIDEDTLTVTRTIPPVATNSHLFGAAVDPATHAVYVTDENRGSVYVIDGATDQVTATIAVGAAPVAVALDPSTNSAYITNRNSHTVSVIDEATNTVVATIPVGSEFFPQYVAVDPTTQFVYVSGYDYVPNSGVMTGSVSVIDATDNTVISTLAGSVQRLGVEVDTSTHLAYVAVPPSSLIPIIGPIRPAVTALSAHSGPAAGGQQLTITGTGFTGADRVVFGTTRVTSFTVVSDTTITVTTPAHAPGVVRVRVHATGLSAKTPATRYTYTP